MFDGWVMGGGSIMGESDASVIQSRSRCFREISESAF
jgi:hypothetical protein